MKVGDLVVTKYTKELGFVVRASSTHCEVFIPKVTRKKDRTFRIHKDQLEVINESR